ncbi:uncharacterized protein EV420DRAFT_1483619 [Desarmillaria tabescens]|uniref:Uncharacterized protein n=1 Tax=Armillaria tabescens TaxID=1929756 RepID=A0AA39JUQ7_ARMTA|nr:uncharacterized protein EV420DRAFT_1483619 [Desarmillaria tabescens]KAK0447804.1 hypothetical protein EV420DRAFT_1483619 [Desarmillaria tabescens]
MSIHGLEVKIFLPRNIQLAIEWRSLNLRLGHAMVDERGEREPVTMEGRERSVTGVRGGCCLHTHCHLNDAVPLLAGRQYIALRQKASFPHGVQLVSPYKTSRTGWWMRGVVAHVRGKEGSAIVFLGVDITLAGRRYIVLGQNSASYTLASPSQDDPSADNFVPCPVRASQISITRPEKGAMAVVRGCKGYEDGSRERTRSEICAHPLLQNHPREVDGGREDRRGSQ